MSQPPTLTIWRGDKKITKTVTLGEQPGERVTSAASTNKSSSKLGLMLKDGRDGVVVAGVEPDRPAAEKGMQNGDIITRANGREVKSAKDVPPDGKMGGPRRQPVVRSR